MKNATFWLTFTSYYLGILLTSSALGAPTSFEFIDGEELDGVGAGATMTRDGITLTSLEAMGPDYDSSGNWDGATFASAETNVLGSGGMALNTDDSDAPNWGSTGNEANGWDAEEYWVYEFDVPVVFDNLAFTSFGNTESCIVTIDDLSYSKTFTGNEVSGDSYDDPFDGLKIPAGADIRITGGGDPNDDSASSHWRLVSLAVDQATAKLTVDRATGQISLSHTLSSPLSIQGYSITSALGGLDPAGWKSIADNYDSDSGDHSVDSDDVWTKLTDEMNITHQDFSEFQFGANPGPGDGGAIGVGESVVLSEVGGWIPSPYEDLDMNLADGNGTIIPVNVEYTGDLLRSDLNYDGNITVADWDIFRQYNGSTLSGFTLPQKYALGDLDADGDSDTYDFALFVSDYDAANGAGAFRALLQSVPEPSSLLLLCLGALVGGAVRRNPRRLSPALMMALALITTGAAQGSPVVFDFVDVSEFDGQPTGATMTREAVKITSLEIMGPDYNSSGLWDGSTFAAGETNIISAGGISIDTDDADAPNWGSTSNEAYGWDPDEYWVFEFDVPVLFNKIHFGSFGDTESATVTIDDLSFTKTFTGADESDDIIDDPFNGLLIPAGTDIRITGGGDANDDSDSSHWRLDSLTVSTSTLEVLINPLTGDTRLYNNKAQSINLANYQIDSPAGALLNANESWNSLSDQNLDPVDDGADSGETWQEMGGSGSETLAESFLLGGTTIAAGESLSIGAPYNTSIADSDMMVTYLDRNGAGPTTGNVTFLGDMDGSGTVDEDDINLFVLALTDRAAYESGQGPFALDADLIGDFNGNGHLDLGDISGFKTALAAAAPAAGAASVPEPSCCLLLVFAVVGRLFGIRRGC